MAKIETDEITGTDTTGHEWDGIKELNTPLPRWWLWTFYLTVIWAIGYVIAYPAIPLVTSYTKGLLGHSTRDAVATEIANAKEAQNVFLEKMSGMELADIRADQNLLQFATAGGKSAYQVNCVQCHGTGAQGAPGYPNLNDDDWIWGGSLEDIHTTLLHGIRNAGDEDTRESLMPAFGEGVLEQPQILAVTEYVLKLSGQEHDGATAEEGLAIYTENCASCHGEDGKGDREQGAPNLTDAIWLYGGSRGEIAQQITVPKHGVMPGWGKRLDENTIKQLTIYIHSLGGGE
ncbi:MAG: cytochrome-c oxidase, cbb3-type subunit III [Hyphomicrobiales bacterium]